MIRVYDNICTNLKYFCILFEAGCPEFTTETAVGLSRVHIGSILFAHLSGAHFITNGGGHC